MVLTNVLIAKIITCKLGLSSSQFYDLTKIFFNQVLCRLYIEMNRMKKSNFCAFLSRSVGFAN
jgi:hypothetical protein